MKKSIMLRLFAGIGGFIVVFVLLSWFLNDRFLERYYLNKKKALLIENSVKLSNMYSGNVLELALELERLENMIGTSILIRSTGGRIVYSSTSRVLDQRLFKRRADIELVLGIGNGKRQEPRNSPGITAGNKETEGNYIFQVQRDDDLKIDFLAMQTTLPNSDILIMRTPLAALKESAEIANRFLFITGLITVFIGSIWAYFFSRKFTRPILELNHIAQNMARLDFTKKCSAATGDELGELGQSINYLSGRLDNTITELNEKNQRLQEDIERERKIDEMRKEFVSNVSHEMKTPLTLIQGYAEGLAANVLESNEDKEFYCRVIVKEAERMDKLVRDLLNLSQLESGQFQLERTVFDISGLIEHTLNKYRSLLREKQLSIFFAKEEELLVQADFIRIEQVLINYINNALDHVDGKKEISIKVEELQRKIRISVFNSGRHIPEEALEKIWGSFYKVDKARTRAYGGTGLGLSIVRGIQEVHGNAYGVQNVEGGVSFWFEVDKTEEDL